jgi:hypothetical protein
MNIEVKVVGSRVVTNNKCDYPNKVGTITSMSETGVAIVVKLDDNFSILTMSYAVDLQK